MKMRDYEDKLQRMQQAAKVRGRGGAWSGPGKTGRRLRRGSHAMRHTPPP